MWFTLCCIYCVRRVFGIYYSKNLMLKYSCWTFLRLVLLTLDELALANVCNESLRGIDIMYINLRLMGARSKFKPDFNFTGPYNADHEHLESLPWLSRVKLKYHVLEESTRYLTQPRYSRMHKCLYLSFTSDNVGHSPFTSVYTS